MPWISPRISAFTPREIRNPGTGDAKRLTDAALRFSANSKPDVENVKKKFYKKCLNPRRSLTRGTGRAQPGFEPAEYKLAVITVARKACTYGPVTYSQTRGRVSRSDNHTTRPLSQIYRRNDGFCRNFGLFYYIRVLTVLVDFSAFDWWFGRARWFTNTWFFENEHLAGLRSSTRENVLNNDE